MIAVKFLKYLQKFIALSLIIAFVVLNHQDTEFYFSPLNDPIIIPLWVLGLGLFLFGALSGAFLTWLNAHPSRRDLKQTKKDLKKLQSDYDILQDKSAISPDPLPIAGETSDTNPQLLN